MTKKAWLAVIVSLLVGLVSGPLSMVYANRVADQAETRIRQESAVSQKAVCDVIGRMRSVYVQEPPSTPTGKESEQAWLDLMVALRCPR